MPWIELTRLLGRHEVRTDKDGRGWSPATYKPGTTRKNHNVRAVSCFVGDVDHATLDDYGAIKQRVTELDLAFLIYSTYSNNPPDDVRFRIVVPFLKPLQTDGSAAEGPALWRRVWQAATAHVLLGQNDPNTKDLSRFFYLPSTPPGYLVLAEHHDGLPLDWEALSLPAVVPSHTLKVERSSGTQPSLGRPTLEFLALGVRVGTQRDRALGATRALLAAGRSIEETADLVWHALSISPCGDEQNPWTHAHTLKLVQDLARRDAQPLLPAPTLGRAKTDDRSRPTNPLRGRAARYAARLRTAS